MITYKQHSSNFLKQFTIAAIIALGAIGMTNCSTDDTAIIDLPTESAAVMFNTSIEKETQTRATSLVDATLQSVGFGVLAYDTQNSAWADAGATADPNFMYNQKVTYGSTWNYSPIKYWPKKTNDKVSFFAYAPYESSPTDGANKGIKLSANTATGTPTIVFTVNTDSIANQVDLVYASTIDKNREVVDLKFKHALSRIAFSAKAAEDYGETVIKVKSISIGGKFHSSGKLNLLDGTWETLPPSDVTYKKDNLNIELNNSSEKQLLGKDQYLMIIPKNFTGASDKVKVTVTYTTTTNGDEISKDVYIENKNFEQSKAYNILLNISLDKITILELDPSNSYIVAPTNTNNRTVYKIPVSRANKSMLGIQLGDDDKFTAELVWTDNPNGIAPNSNIKSISVERTDSTRYLIVEPGSAEGNAVVAIKNAAGKILWSWHIWVTDYAPPTTATKNTFMDRNLGAIGKTPGEVGTRGLMYQWGRKDPFPNSSTVNGDAKVNEEPKIYNAAGETEIAKVVTTASSNFGNTVANPATYYRGAAGNGHDWYSSTSGERNDNLWGPDTKTVYDPCPVGWRVPNSSVWRGLSNGNFSWNNYGRTNNVYGGYYPFTGYRDSDGKLDEVGEKGHYWSSNVRVKNGEYMGENIEFKSNSFANNGNFRERGFSVRCVKE